MAMGLELKNRNRGKMISYFEFMPNSKRETWVSKIISLRLGLILMVSMIHIYGCSSNSEQPEILNRDLEVLNGNDTSSIYLVIKPGEATNISDTSNALFFKRIKAKEKSGKVEIGAINKFTILYTWETLDSTPSFGVTPSTQYHSRSELFTIDENSPTSMNLRIREDAIGFVK
jgi:hypothetical protein